VNNASSRPIVLECPGCGATLALPDADTFECDYCGKHIVVPPELRPKQANIAYTPEEDSSNFGKAELPVPITSRTQMAMGKQKQTRLIVIITAIILLLACGSLIPFFFITAYSVSKTASEPQFTPLRTTPLPTMVKFANLALVFGSKGDQPGQFEDARSIAIDNQGNIFVADYTHGRINKFDQQGNFLQLIEVESTGGNSDVYIYGIATDAIGNLFVASSGNILKFATASGELLLTIPDQWPEIYYQSVVVAPDGNLYSTNGMAGADDILILDSQGQLLDHWTDTIENVNHDDPAMDLSLGVNHSGMVYILSPFGNQVYAYNPNGSFNYRFGEEGDRAGQFSLSTGLLAITEQDELVISDVYRVDLFDALGNYLNQTFTIDYNVAEGSMFGMTIDSQGDLYFISSGGKVLKYEMNYP